MNLEDLVKENLLEEIKAFLAVKCIIDLQSRGQFVTDDQKDLKDEWIKQALKNYNKPKRKYDA